MFIDVHCHLTDEKFASVGGTEEVLRRAREAGVRGFVCAGFDLASSYAAAELAEREDDVYFCAGFQPEELSGFRDGDLEKLSELLKLPECVAVGEIGLDYHFPDNPGKELQKELFAAQLALAAEAELPVVVHSRDACADTLEILRSNRSLLKRGGLMHCYSYSAESVRDFAELGFYFSFGGTSTFRNAKKVKESAALVPADRILTETDCPYLSPEPFRGVFPNEPKNVVYVLKNLAVLRREEEEVLKARIVANAKRLFFKIKGIKE